MHNVERVTGKQVQHLKIASADTAGPTQVRGNEVAVFQKKDLPQKKDLKTVESRNTSAQRTQPQANRDQNRQTLESQQQPKRETAQDQARTAYERQQAEQQQAAQAKQNADHTCGNLKPRCQHRDAT